MFIFWAGFSLAIVLGELMGVPGAALAGALGGGAAVRAIFRYPFERWMWGALAIACAPLVVGPFELSGGATHSVGASSVADLAAFVFGTSAAAAFLAWPEIRSSSLRVVGTLVDTATIVLAVTLWGMAGFAPLGALLPAGALVGVAHAGILLVPAITAFLAVPQLTSERRQRGIALGAAMAGLWAAGLMSSAEIAVLGDWKFVSSVIYGAAFGLLGWVGLGPHPAASATPQVASDLIQPPLRFPGIIGLAAVALLVATRPPPLFLVGLVLILGARETLHTLGRRRAHDQLESSLQLEARLLDVQSRVRPEAVPADTLGESCNLAVDVLRADAALAWVVDVDVLSLAAIAPARRDVLLGRRLLLSDLESLAPRVFRAGEPEFCEVRTPGVRVDRFLTTVLDAGAVLGVPITREGAPVGVLVLVRERGRDAFSHFDLQRAKLIVAQTEGALRRLELYDELERQLRETTLVHRFAVQAVTARKPNDVAWYLLESIRSRVPFDRAAVFLTDDGSRMSLTPIAHFHPPNTNRAQAETALAHLRIPLQYGETVIGYADLYRSDVEPFSVGETAIGARLAQQAAVAIQNVRLQEVSGKVTTYRELDRLKTELLNSVSHDLRGPLSNIKGYASTLVESSHDMSDEEQLEFLQTIEEEADRLRDLLDHLLDLSKIEAGVLTLDLHPVQLARIVAQTVSGVKSAQHQVETSIPEAVFVMADGRRLRQVLHNLVENAMKYSPNGGSISIRADLTDSEVVLSVQDSGVGIPRHQWDRVFRPYQRADTARSHGIAGNGLGLAICKGIVEAHNGRIWLESEVGVGTTFSFTMPGGFNVLDDPLQGEP